MIFASDRILYQQGAYTVRRDAKWFGVYREGVTVAERVAQIGGLDPAWFVRACQEADRRAARDAQTAAEHADRA